MSVLRDPESRKPALEHLAVLSKHRWLITGISLLTVITVAIWTFLQVPIYRATATLLLDPEPPRVLNIEEVTPLGTSSWDPSYYATQYEIIQSRPVLERAAQSLNLAQRAPGLALRGAVSVEPKRNTRLLFVRYESPDPVLAADVANAVANAYVQYNLDLRFKGARNALSWLTNEAAALRKKVEDSSAALQNYRVKANILGTQEQRQITAQKIIDFNKAYLDAQAQRLSIEAKLQQLTQAAKDPRAAQSFFSAAADPIIEKLKSDASSLQIEKSKLLRTYKEQHPEIQKVNAQLRQIDQRIDDEIQSRIQALQTDYKVAKAREDTLLSNVNQLKREGQELNEKEIQVLALQREVESNQQLYEVVVKRLKETGVAGGLETNNVRLMEEASPPKTPVRPRRLWNLFLSVVAGLGVGIAVAFIIDYFDTTVKTPDDVERYLGLPVIGVIPTFEGKR
jgi:succinoglycan biosynthesis transport protein ExoP